jgi:hypothetical protein
MNPNDSPDNREFSDLKTQQKKPKWLSCTNSNNGKTGLYKFK